VEVEGCEEISMWLMYSESADPKHNGANEVIGKFTIHKLAFVELARKHCDPSGGGGNWVEYAVDELGAADATRLSGRMSCQNPAAGLSGGLRHGDAKAAAAARSNEPWLLQPSSSSLLIPNPFSSAPLCPATFLF